MTSPQPPSPPPIVWQSRPARFLGWAQGLFYAVSGIWPVLHIRSFMAVTGPKVDVWLVQTVGGLLTVTGLALLVATKRNRLAGEWALLAGGQAAVLAVVDLIFVSRGRISPIYLLDAAAEGVLVAGWVALAVWSTQVGRPAAALPDAPSRHP